MEAPGAGDLYVVRTTAGVAVHGVWGVSAEAVFGCMRFARVDQNHSEIVEALRRRGWLVRSTAAVGSGFPDLVISRAGVVKLVEVKKGKGKLTPDQVRFIDDGWPVIVIREYDDLTKLL